MITMQQTSPKLSYIEKLMHAMGSIAESLMQYPYMEKRLFVNIFYDWK